MEEQKRAAIVVGLRAGRTAAEIAEFNKLPESLCYRVKKKLDESVAAGEDPDDISVDRKTHKRRRDAIRTPEFIEQLQNMIDEDPSKSIRALARELNVDEKTVRNCVHEDIRYKSYALKKHQFMNEATMERRADKAARLLVKLKHPQAQNQLIFFSDEKNFCQDQKVNKRNDRWLCADVEEVPVVMSTKFPATVMVLGVISSEGDVMPPFFFEEGLRVNADAYIHVMDTVVKPWMEGIAGDRHYVFQQDGAPAHTANKTQAWLADNLKEFWPKNIWPPSSPDCNPCDFFLWGVCEREVNKCPHNTKASLKTKITQVMAGLDKDMVANACRRFRSRIERVVDADGGFIE